MHWKFIRPYRNRMSDVCPCTPPFRWWFPTLPPPFSFHWNSRTTTSRRRSVTIRRLRQLILLWFFCSSCTIRIVTVECEDGDILFSNNNNNNNEMVEHDDDDATATILPVSVAATTTVLLKHITQLVLVNCETGHDILVIAPNMTIDTTRFGTDAFTIRADVVDVTNSTSNSSSSSSSSTNSDNDTTVSSSSSYYYAHYLLWDMDHGISRRIESSPPYLLAGKEEKASSASSSSSSYTFFPSNLLRKEGWHTVMATPVSTMNAIADRTKNNNNLTFSRTFYMQHSNTTTTPTTSTIIGSDSFYDSSSSSNNENDMPGVSLACDTAVAGSIESSSWSSGCRRNNITDVLPIRADRFGTWNYMVPSVIYPNDTTVTSTNHQTTTTTTSNTTSHTLILAWAGPMASERGMTDPGVEYRTPSTFADYRCDIIVTRIHSDPDYEMTNTASNSSNSSSLTTTTTTHRMIYPCYYSGTGNAANTGDVGGLIWQCPIRWSSTKRWSNDTTTTTTNTSSSDALYSWKVSFVYGTNIATTTYMSGAQGNPAEFFHQQTGTIPLDHNENLDNTVGTVPFPKSASFYTGLDTLDFLNYREFDGISNGGSNVVNQSKTYSSYRTYVSNTSTTTVIQNPPTWGGGRGRGIMGAISKIHDTPNMNVLCLTTLSISNHIFPFVDPFNDRLSYDISKLAQWEVVFRYAADIGVSILLHLNEDTIFDYEEQHLYVREMVARFGPYVSAYTVSSLPMAQYIRTLHGDPNVTLPSASILWRINTNTEAVSLSEQIYTIDGIFMSMNNPTSSTIYENCKDWKQTNPHIAMFISVILPVSDDANQRRYSDLIWSTLFAGGVGVLIQPTIDSSDGTENGVMEVIHDDTNVLNDPSIAVTRTIWEQRFLSMATFQTLCNDILVSATYFRCLSDVTFTYIAIYAGSNSTDEEVLIKEQFWYGTNVQYGVEWVDPTTGIIETTDITLISSNQTGLGTPPSSTNDWIALLHLR